MPRECPLPEIAYAALTVHEELARIDGTEIAVLGGAPQLDYVLEAELEAGPGLAGAPAAQHELVQPGRAVEGLGQTAAGSDVVQHLEIRARLVGLLAERGDLPHEDAEGPDVALGGEDAVDEGLGRHPAHRQ